MIPDPTNVTPATTTPSRVTSGYATPVFHVRSIEESIRFYERLGFEVIDTDRTEPLGWARLHVEGGAIMFVASEAPLAASEERGVLLYLYTPDLAGLRAQLAASGVEVSPICYPEYMPSGEMRLEDPDGYVIMVGHWGAAEHEAWLERIGRRG